MSDAVMTALIGGAVTLVGVIISYKAATDKMQHTLEVHQAVMDTKISSMQEDIKEHNHYAKLFSESMPVVQEQIKVINHRIEDLEQAAK